MDEMKKKKDNRSADEFSLELLLMFFHTVDEDAAPTKPDWRVKGGQQSPFPKSIGLLLLFRNFLSIFHKTSFIFFCFQGQNSKNWIAD